MPRRAFALIFALALVAQVAPLAVTRVLPFHDAPGIEGLCGVFAHTDNPAARIAEFYDIDFGPYPSVLYFAWGFAAAKLHVPVDLAFNLFIAIFCVAGPALAMLVLLPAFGRPRELALLALPVTFHQQIWYGFVGSAAAVPGLLLALAFAKEVVDRPRPRAYLGLAGALLFTAFAHPFALTMTLAVCAPLPLWRGTVRARGLRLLCVVPTALFLAAWASTFFGGGNDRVRVGARLARELRLERPPLLDDARVFLDWLGGGYAGHIDELVALVALAGLALFLARGVRDAALDDRSGRLWLAWACGILLAGYLLLPNRVNWPTYWWGLRVRCALPLFLVAIVAVRISPRGLPRSALVLPAAVALAFGVYVTVDLATYWRGRVLDGFDQAIDAIPPGQSVLGMPALRERHYGRAHPYLVQYYVARKGGRAVPYLGGHPGSYWVTARPAPQAPPWGDPAQFVWQEHGAGYDYFLLERPMDGVWPEPFRDAPVTLVSDRGQWRLYRRTDPAAPP